MNKGKTQHFVQLLVQVDRRTNEKISTLAQRSNRTPADLVVLAMTYAVLPESYYGIEQVEQVSDSTGQSRIEVSVARSFFQLLHRMGINTATARGFLAARGLALVLEHLRRVEEEDGDNEA